MEEAKELSKGALSQMLRTTEEKPPALILQAVDVRESKDLDQVSLFLVYFGMQTHSLSDGVSSCRAVYKSDAVHKVSVATESAAAAETIKKFDIVKVEDYMPAFQRGLYVPRFLC
ncbi:MAG: hypothetical protein P4M11_01250 [Candidatus Pacebacteria bacterium]|nr:hypothetical protein [Candidatus Paceibacterota bacterium]